MKKTPLFKNKRLQNAILLILIVAFVMSSIIILNSHQKSLSTGDTVNAELLMNHVFRISDCETDQKGISKLVLHVKGELDPEQLGFSIFRARNITFYDQNGNSYSSDPEDYYQHARYAALEKYEYDTVTGTLTLRWYAADFFNSYYMFFGSAESQRAQGETWKRIHDIALGIMLMMLVYSLTLFFNKRDERYMATFAVYIGITSLMTVLNRGFLVSGKLYDLYNEIVPFLIMLILCVEVSTLVHLLDVQPRWWMKPFRSWMFILCVSLAYFGICALNIMLLKEISRLIVIGIGFSVVVEGMAHNKKMAFIVCIGYVISEAINLVPMGINLGFYDDSFGLAMFRTGRIYGIPFAFACMYFINWKFANRFKETERLSEELEKTNRSLDLIVQERTQAAVEQMNKRHSLMLNIFHDIRSPLFILKGCMQILFDENENPAEQKEIKQMAKEKLELMSNLTDNIFLLAKLEDENFLFSYARVDIAALVARLSHSWKLSAEQSGHSFRKKIQVHEAPVWCDALRMEQVLENIVGNAFRYTPEGGSVAVSVHRRSDNVIITVEDNGIGIEAERLHTIFDRYYRADPTSKKSSGLGLAIAQGIVQRHNGLLHVKSEAGKGSVFSVELPLLKSDKGEVK